MVCSDDRCAGVIWKGECECDHVAWPRRGARGILNLGRSIVWVDLAEGLARDRRRWSEWWAKADVNAPKLFFEELELLLPSN